MVVDAHIHSCLSPDSKLEPQFAIEYLRKAGLGCCFTEHVDFVTPTEGRDYTASDHPRISHDFVMDKLDEYPACYKKFKGPDVFFGLEVSLTAAFYPLNKSTAAKEGLDFVIGSVHYVDGWDIYFDYYKECEGDGYRRYLDYTLMMVEQNEFYDSLGHIDYISRRSPFKEKEALLADYKPEYKKIFKAVIEKGKVIELSTKRLGDPYACKNIFNVYNYYRSLGGKYITIGSDAHNAESLGQHFPEALRLAHEADLKPVFYRDRKMIIY